MNVELKIVDTAEEMENGYPFAVLLNDDLEKEVYQKRIEEMVPRGFKMLIALVDGRWAGVSGFWINTRIYSGRYLEPDNVAILPEFQNKGIGDLMIRELERIAKENHCEAMMLDAYIPNTNAHRFYERYGFVKKGFHFIRYFHRPNISAYDEQKGSC